MADRHQFRAVWHPYNEGVYFVTICCAHKEHLFGEIFDGFMKMNSVGCIVEQLIIQIPQHHYFAVEVWNYVVMPNHVHLVLYIAPSVLPEKIDNIGAIKAPKHGEACLDNHFNSKLAIVVRTFKAAVTREVRIFAPGVQIWQRSFHDHIIRNQRAFDNIMNYIDTNVERWESDCFHHKR